VSSGVKHLNVESQDTILTQSIQNLGYLG